MTDSARQRWRGCAATADAGENLTTPHQCLRLPDVLQIDRFPGAAHDACQLGTRRRSYGDRVDLLSELSVEDPFHYVKPQIQGLGAVAIK